MKNFYCLAAAIPRHAYLTGAYAAYLMMLAMGTLEPALESLPGREGFSGFYHLAFYFLLAAMLWFGLEVPSVAAVLLLIVAAGAIDELHQCFLPFRHPALTGVALDGLAGIAAAITLQRAGQEAGVLAPIARSTHTGP